MARHGLLVGSPLTAIPFFLIHLRLAFEAHGWAGTPWGEAALDWALLAVAAPFFRYPGRHRPRRHRRQRARRGAAARLLQRTARPAVSGRVSRAVNSRTAVIGVTAIQFRKRPTEG
jgi:hypothetical protein